MEWPIDWFDVKESIERLEPKVIDLREYNVTLNDGTEATLNDVMIGQLSSTSPQIIQVTHTGTFWKDVDTDAPIKCYLSIPDEGDMLVNISGVSRYANGNLMGVSASVPVIFYNMGMRFSFVLGAALGDPEIIAIFVTNESMMV